MQLINSSLDYFTLDDKNKTSATLVEREGFFLIENGNKDLYTYVEGFAQEYVGRNKVKL